MVSCGTACSSWSLLESQAQTHRPLPTSCCCSTSTNHHRRLKKKKLLAPPSAAAAASQSCSSSNILHEDAAADTALLALLRAHDTDAAFALFSSNPDLLPSSAVTASRLLAQLCFRPDFPRAAALLQRLRARDALSLLDANALSLAAAAAARSGNAALAHSLILYTLRQGLFPDRRAYTAVVSRLDPPSKAVRLFRAVLRHLRRAHHHHNLVVPEPCLPDAAAFNAALSACADAGDCRAFRDLFDEMRDGSSTARPDAVTYNVVIKMCARAGRRDLVARVPERMAAAGVPPSAATFHSVVAALVGFADVRAAETVVQALREGRAGDICSILRASSSSSMASETEQQSTASASAASVVLEDIVVGKHSEEPNARVYTTLMKGYMNAGRVDDVLATLRAMQHEAKTVPASRPDQVTFTTVISALVAAGDVDRARRVLDEEMAAAGVPATRVTYNVLLKGYCQQLQIAKARALFQDMVETVGIDPDVVTYNTLMDGCVLTDDTAGAVALFNEMRSRGVAPSAVSYTTLMKAFAASGQPKLAHKVFHEMQRDPNRVTVDRAAWNMLLEAYCRLGLLDTAKQIVESMKSSSVQPDVATYGSLAKAIAVARKPGEALLLWNEVKERCPDPDEELLEALADVCVRAAFFKKALEIVACMEERGIAPNKAKYKKMYIEMHSRMFTSKHASQARQDRRRERKRAAEAFKFWLGLPNEYYGTSSEWRIEPLPNLEDDYY
ncbi:hypothetical protein PR202_ga25034 [Eleusine coracana subsp. coracana]|uniref:Pentatricopeptide repeat-containing protein n=1 Tax=Eleusine coracana subsp. coracana TaxID=191504 RepID=A0AAV5DAA3_ELECO|nr:hypothetical protein PR202_ga25034 [Eleusine coracana subsp. coracana]